jgi:hypothetical protein
MIDILSIPVLAILLGLTMIIGFAIADAFR